MGGEEHLVFELLQVGPPEFQHAGVNPREAGLLPYWLLDILNMRGCASLRLEEPFFANGSPNSEGHISTSFLGLIAEETVKDYIELPRPKWFYKQTLL